MARFLFDEDTQGVGKLIAKARRDTWVIGQSPCPIRKRTPDEKWFPVAGEKRLVVFRKDKDLLDRGSAEYRSWTQNRCRGFVLVTKDQELWTQLETIVRFWDRIENHVSDRGKGPWVSKITASGIQIT